MLSSEMMPMQPLAEQSPLNEAEPSSPTSYSESIQPVVYLVWTAI